MTTLTIYDRVRFVCLVFGQRSDGRYGHNVYTLQITRGLRASYHTAGRVSVLLDRIGGPVWEQPGPQFPSRGETWWVNLLIPEGVAI